MYMTEPRVDFPKISDSEKAARPIPIEWKRQTCCMYFEDIDL